MGEIMKNTSFIGMFLLLIGFAASAQTDATLKLEVLEDMRQESLINDLDFRYQQMQLERQQLQKRALKQPSQRPIMRGGTASISGTVTSSALPVSAVTINLLDANTNQYLDSFSTNALGEFSFTGLLAGDYYLLANDNSDVYVDVMWSSVGMVQCQYCQADADSTINLSAGAAETGFDFDLDVGATVNGNVTDGSSTNSGQNIVLRGVSPNNYYVSAPTDGAGNYTFMGLPAGDYYVTFSDPHDSYIDVMYSSTGTVQCYSCEPDVDSTLSVALGETRNGIDLLLTVGATISGSLIDEVTLAQVDTLFVNLYEPGSTEYWYHSAQFDGSGNYTISGIRAGTYKAYLEPSIDLGNEYIPEIYNNIQCNACSSLLYDGAGDALNLVNGATTSNVDFAVAKGASISGIILNNDYPTETIENLGLIYLFNDSNRVLTYQLIYGTNNDPMADGTYKIGGLLPGMYFVQAGDLGREFFQRELFENIHCPWSGCDRGGGGDPVVLGASEQRLGVNYLLNYGGKISGTVVDASTNLPIDTGNQTQYIQFYDAAGEVAGGAGINPDGTYISQRALPPGTYSVRTGTMFLGEFNSPYVMQKYDGSGNIDCPGVTCDLTAGNVTVTAYARLDPRDPQAEADNATVTNIDFALSPGFSFSGTITELGSATPIPEVHVLVYDDNGNFANWATTDVNGDFTVHGLPAGTYYALTNNGSNLPFMGVNQTTSGGWIDILYDGTACPGSACDVTTGDPIVLGGSPGIETVNGVTGGNIDFGMAAGGTLSGQVRNFESQLPASAVTINVYDDAGNFNGSYQTDDAGYYMTAGLPPGTYYLTTSNNGALIDALYGGGYCADQSCDPLAATPLIITGDEDLTNRDFELKPDFIFRSGLD